MKGDSNEMAIQMEYNATENQRLDVQGIGDYRGASSKHSLTTEYGELAEGLALLFKCVEELSGKLTPVLGPPTPRVEAKENSNGRQGSPFAESINGDILRVKRLIADMRELTERVDL